MDMLEIKGLRVLTHIGVHAWEHKILQTLLIDIHIPTDISKCQDYLENTIDYDKLCQNVTTYIETHSFNLIETVADKVALLIKSSFALTKITVSVSKPRAVKNAMDIRITITR